MRGWAVVIVGTSGESETPDDTRRRHGAHDLAIAALAGWSRGGLAVEPRRDRRTPVRPFRPAEQADPAAEQLILAFDELASNALRHGESPVVATVVAGSGGWLLDVSDRAPEVMPAPAVDRDPAQGGLGLHLVARLSVAHGWYVDGSCKHVWACLPTEQRVERCYGRTSERPPLP
jgi:hypothetical protein